MKNTTKLIYLILIFACMITVATGAVHLERFVDGPLRHSGLAIIVIGIPLFILLSFRKIVFKDNALEIKSLIDKKRVIPYEIIKSVEYIETKISSGKGIKTKVRNIRFNLEDNERIQFAETDIRYKKTVKQLMAACDSGNFPGRAISSDTRARLLDSINQK